MGTLKLENILVTPLKRIEVLGGDVLHGMKATDPGFCGYGEAYFSIVMQGAIKAWKMHRKMTLNLIVPEGEVQFVFYLPDSKLYRTEIVGTERYVRLTVPPGIWFGFQGLTAPQSLILNIANIAHEPDEVTRKAQEEINFNWNL